MIVGNIIGGVPMSPKTCIFQTENGQEFYATLVDSKVVLTAGTNDIRIGKTAVTDNGLTEGEKIIPAYHTFEGYRVITKGSAVTIPNASDIADGYDYTKLQAMICLFNTKEANSVAVEKAVINSNVYNVGSTEVVSAVIKNHETKTIELGITNDSSNMWILRYFMYKEVK